MADVFIMADMPEPEKFYRKGKYPFHELTEPGMAFLVPFSGEKSKYGPDKATLRVRSAVHYFNKHNAGAHLQARVSKQGIIVRRES